MSMHEATIIDRIAPSPRFPGGSRTAEDVEFGTRVTAGNGVFPVYQPIYGADGKCAAVEALVRYRTATNRLMGAGEAIEVSRRLGLLRTLGAAAIRRAVQEFARCKRMAQAPKCLNINLAKEEVLDPSTLDHLMAAVKDAGLEPEDLTVEITEDCPQALHAAVAEVATEFRRQGFRIALDDFGSGSNDLMLLRTFTPDIVKLDKFFVRHLTDDDPLIKGIVDTVHAMNVKVVVEGVETLKQRRILSALNVDYLQGFLLGKPMPAPATCPPNQW